MAAPRLLAALFLSVVSVMVCAEDLTVHIIPHSHCDPGWLESFEGYYLSQVHTILSSVTEALTADKRRKFIWAEMSFWMRWYEVQSDETKARVQSFVASGQLEFVGGGWVQNDEANPDYAAIISQVTEGNEYLQTLFGTRPRIAWQIDPFGHSAAMAAVAAAAGYEGLVINRIEHTIKDALKGRAAMEFLWQPYTASPLLDKDLAQSVDPDTIASSYSNTSIFTHVLHTHYSAPRGYDFENPEGFPVGDYNIQSRASELVRELRSRARAYRTSHLLVPFGDDFKFQDAFRQFSSMDKLIDYVNARNGRDDNGLYLKDAAQAVEGEYSGVKLQYSTLSTYFAAVRAESQGQSASAPASAASKNPVSIPFPVYTPRNFIDGGADFFPYADNQNSFWTGYYVSRPQLKGAIRRTTALLRGAESFLALVRPWAGSWQDAAGSALAAFAEASAETSEAKERLALSAAPYASYSWLRAFQRIEQVRLDVALCLHHDAITGTSRESVVHDYTKRMFEGFRDVKNMITDLASLQLGGLSKAVQGAIATAGGDDGSDVGGQKPLKGPLGMTRRIQSKQGSKSASSVEAVTLAPAPLTYIPHVLPVPDAVAISVIDDAGADADSITLSADTPSHPVVIFNPSGWRRKAVMSVMVDVGSAVADAIGSAKDASEGKESSDDAAPACRATQWPFAIVTDADGVVVASQWVGLVEQIAAAREIFVNAPKGVTRDAAGEDARGRPLTQLVEPSSASITPPSGWIAEGVRYELAFSTDLPPLSLSTYFVTVAWRAVREGAETEESGYCGTRDPVLRARGAAGTSAAIIVPGLRVNEYQPPADAAGADGSSGKKKALPGYGALVKGSSADEDSADAAVATTVGEEIMQERLVAAPASFSSDRRKSDAAAGDAPIILENGCMIVEVDPLTGLLSAITRKFASPDDGADGGAGVRAEVKQSFGGYHTRQSGAYIFRPLSEPDAFGQGRGDFNSNEPSTEFTVSVTVAPHGDQFDVESSVADAQRHAGGELLSIVRVAGNQYSQTIRLSDTIGWHTGAAASADQCNDPLLPDSGIEIVPSITASGNEEVVMILETDIDIVSSPAQKWEPTNPRDNIHHSTYTPTGNEAADEACAEDDSDGGYCRLGLMASAGECGSIVPHGWWTSDGLGLLRRQPARADTAASELTRHFYPLNALTRISGSVPSTDGDGAAPPTAWLSLYTQQPFGVISRVRNLPESKRGTRMEIMIHRHLSQDDGRGLASSVSDTTKLSPNILLRMGAQACSGISDKAKTSASSDVSAALNPDWVWTWGTTYAIHNQQLTLLHADLDADALYNIGKKCASSDAASTDSKSAEQKGHIVPPLEHALGLGIGDDALVVLAEAAVPRSVWTARFATSFSGLPSSTVTSALSKSTKASDGAATAFYGPLPPWIHLLTLQARDAVTDDITLRLQNVGGVTVSVDIYKLLGAPTSTQPLPLSITSLKPRSLSMSMDARKARSIHEASAAARPSALAASTRKLVQEHPFAGADILSAMRVSADDVRSHLAAVLSQVSANKAQALIDANDKDTSGGGDNQNTDEAGVFLSDAAMAQRKADQAALDNRGAQERQAPPPAVKQQQPIDDGRRKAQQPRPPQKAGGRRGRQLAEVSSTAAVPVSGLPVVAAARKAGTAVLQPSSFATFVLALEAPTAASAAIVVSDAPVPVTGKKPAATKPLTPKNDDDGANDDRSNAAVMSDDQKASLLELIEFVELSQMEKLRMQEIAKAGKDLSAIDKRKLLNASRKAGRKHNQEPPSKLSELVDRLVAAHKANGGDAVKAILGGGSDDDSKARSKTDGQGSDSGKEPTTGAGEAQQSQDPRVLPADEWSKISQDSEHRDFFDDSRIGKKPAAVGKAGHDHDGAPVAVDFINNGVDDGGSDFPMMAAMVSVALWGFVAICFGGCVIFGMTRRKIGTSGSRGVGHSRSTSGVRSVLPTSAQNGSSNGDGASSSWFSWRSLKNAAYPAKMV